MFHVPNNADDFSVGKLATQTKAYARTLRTPFLFLHILTLSGLVL